MGSGIVQVAAQAGFRTVVVEASEALLDRGLAGLGRTLDGLIAKAKLDAAGKQQILDRITGATDFSAFKDCDLVIEAITENQALKNETFAKLDAVCPSHALLASNTSSCNVTALAAAPKRPAQVLGLHDGKLVPCALPSIVARGEIAMVWHARTIGVHSPLGECTALDVWLRVTQDDCFTNGLPSTDEVAGSGISIVE